MNNIGILSAEENLKNALRETAVSASEQLRALVKSKADQKKANTQRLREVAPLGAEHACLPWEQSGVIGFDPLRWLHSQFLACTGQTERGIPIEHKPIGNTNIFATVIVTPIVLASIAYAATQHTAAPAPAPSQTHVSQKQKLERHDRVISKRHRR